MRREVSGPWTAGGTFTPRRRVVVRVFNRPDAGVTIFDYDDNLVCETEIIARFLDCERDLSLGEIFAAR